MTATSACSVARADGIATVVLHPPAALPRGTADLHHELAEVLAALRADDGVRVVVLTGGGDSFYVPARTAFYDSDAAFDYLVEPDGANRTLRAILRLHETIAAMEKPVVCRLNGDAVSLGASLMFAADFVVAVDTACVRDTHLANRGSAGVGAGAGVVPGDGGGVLASLYLPLPLAREFLLLAREFTAPELERWGVVNRIVPAEQLDGAVNEYVAALRALPPSAVAWTKRVINAPVSRALAGADAAAAFELLGFAQRALRDGHARLPGRTPRT